MQRTPSTPAIHTIQSIASAAGMIAARQEAGQAETPLSRLFEGIQAGAEGPPLRALLTGSTSEAVSGVLTSLLGHDYPVLRVSVPSEIGYTELVLQEQGFSFELGSTRREFGEMGSFIQALEEADFGRPGSSEPWLEPLRLCLPGPVGRSGLVLLIPDSIAEMNRRPSLLSVLANKADWIILAAPAGHAFPASEQGLLQMLIKEIGVWLPVECGPNDKLAGGGASAFQEVLPEEGCLSPRVAKSKDSSESKAPGWLAELTATGSDGRALLLAYRRLRHLEGGLAGLTENLQSGLRHAQNRIKLQGSGLISAAGAETSLRGHADRIRNEVQEEIEVLRRAFEENSRSSLVAGGSFHTTTAQLAAAMNASDLQQDEAAEKIRLTLSAAALQRCRDGLLAQCRKQLGTEVEVVLDTFEILVKKIETTLQTLSDTNVRLHREEPGEEEVWRPIQQLASPEVRYRGELPRLNFMSRLSSARQGIMGIFMVVMVVGGAVKMLGGDYETKMRIWTGGLMLPVFVIGFLFTFKSFGKKRENHLEAELLKVHDTVQQELRRVAAEMQREKNTRLGMMLQRMVKNLLQGVQDELAQIESRSRAADEKKRKEAALQTRSVEMKLQDLQRQLGEVIRLQGDARRIWQDLDQWRARWVNAPAPSSLSPTNLR